MDDRMAVTAGALIGACLGAAASYLFLTDRGRSVLRDQMGPAFDDLQRELGRFRGTFEQVGRMASEGARVMQEFSSARAQASNSGTSH